MSNGLLSLPAVAGERFRSWRQRFG